eukprot:EG_transcript_22429
MCTVFLCWACPGATGSPCECAGPAPCNPQRWPTKQLKACLKDAGIPLPRKESHAQLVELVEWHRLAGGPSGLQSYRQGFLQLCKDVSLVCGLFGAPCLALVTLLAYKWAECRAWLLASTDDLALWKRLGLSAAEGSSLKAAFQKHQLPAGVIRGAQLGKVLDELHIDVGSITLVGIEFRYAEFLQWAQQRLDFRARALRPYGVGDTVELFVRRQQTWRPGVVEAVAARHYHIRHGVDAAGDGDVTLVAFVDTSTVLRPRPRPLPSLTGGGARPVPGLRPRPP